MKKAWKCSTGIRKATYETLHLFYRDMLSTKLNDDLQYRYGLLVGYLIGSSSLMTGGLSSAFLSVIFKAYDRKKKELKERG
jgi:hypothetical protein